MQKIFTNTEKQAEPFPQLQDYDKLVYTPEQLADINPTEGNKLNTAINDQGQVISDIINSALNTQSKEILASYTFGSSGAIKIATDANNGIWISPSGILAKKGGATKFTITNGGDATFAGKLDAASGTFGSITAGSLSGVTISGGTITGGTITGSTIQTATSGERIVLGTDNYLSFYDSNGNLAGRFSAEVGGQVKISGKFYVNDDLQVIGNSFLGDAVEINTWTEQALYPYHDGANDLGGAYNSWKNIYSVDGTFSGAISLPYLYLGGGNREIRPIGGNIGHLGTSTYYWYVLYVNNLRYKNADTFQTHDDIALMKNIKAKEIEKEIPLSGSLSNGKIKTTKIKKKVWDISTLPKETVDGEFINGNAMSGFLIGTMKQLIERVESLEQKANSNLINKKYVSQK